MTSQEAKSYLMQYRESLDRTREITQHLDELKSEAVRLKDHEGQSVKLDEATAKYMDACDESADELNRLAELRNGIKREIEAINDNRLRKLLTEVYINGTKLVRYAANLDQSYEHICRLHGEALRAVCEAMRQI